MTHPDKGGAPEGNQHAAKHHLYSDDSALFQSLSDDEAELFWAIADDLMERTDVTLDKQKLSTIRSLALDTIKRQKANEWLFAKEDMFSFDNSHVHELYSKLRRDNTKEMKELNLLQDNPENKAHEAEADWHDLMADVEDDE